MKIFNINYNSISYVKTLVSFLSKCVINNNFPLNPRGRCSSRYNWYTLIVKNKTYLSICVV